MSSEYAHIPGIIKRAMRAEALIDRAGASIEFTTPLLKRMLGVGRGAPSFFEGKFKGMKIDVSGPEDIVNAVRRIAKGGKPAGALDNKVDSILSGALGARSMATKDEVLDAVIRATKDGAKVTAESF
jgi:hypothetical protein